MLGGGAPLEQWTASPCSSKGFIGWKYDSPSLHGVSGRVFWYCAEGDI